MIDNQQIIRDAEHYHAVCEYLRGFAARPFDIENDNGDVNDNYESGFKDGETHLARVILSLYKDERF